MILASNYLIDYSVIEHFPGRYLDILTADEWSNFLDNLAFQKEKILFQIFDFNLFSSR